MKGKKPTREQRSVFKRNKLDSRDWLVQKNTLEYLQIVHKETKEVRIIYKE